MTWTLAAVFLTLLAAPAIGGELYIDSIRDKQGEMMTITVWDSSASQEECSRASMQRLHDASATLDQGIKDANSRTALAIAQRRFSSDLRRAGKVPICDAGKVAEITHGTTVKPLGDNKACGDKMAFVEIVSGREQGKRGCVPKARLIAERPN